MNNRHAYLIIAHNEFEILRLLVKAIDDNRNDIYILIDKKVKDVPSISSEYSELYLLNDKERINVRWGTKSQIEAEFVLFKKARKNKDYSYYHLISGVHLPLKSQDKIHSFFDDGEQGEYLQIMPTTYEEIRFKLLYYHLFSQYYMDKRFLMRNISISLWRISLFVEKILGISRHLRHRYIKSSNWVSITQRAVDYLLSQENQIKKEYDHTFCADEFFVATTISESKKFKIIKCDKLLKVNFERGNPIKYTLDWYDDLINSDCIFARKFSSSDIEVAIKIVSNF